MRVIKLEGVERNYEYQWPADTEVYDYVIRYKAVAVDGEHNVLIGFCTRKVYEKDRIRIVVWIDNQPQAEFFGADDFEKSGDVLSEIRIPGEVGERICRYPDEPIPERYEMFNVEGLPVRVKAKGVHNSWAVVSNIADHKTLVALASLRRFERARKRASGSM
ncbi:MAG: hypothetical protein QW051_03425 [Candidatus Aenigmatarchaeota archaeon]